MSQETRFPVDFRTTAFHYEIAHIWAGGFARVYTLLSYALAFSITLRFPSFEIYAKWIFLAPFAIVNLNFIFWLIRAYKGREILAVELSKGYKTIPNGKNVPLVHPISGIVVPISGAPESLTYRAWRNALYEHSTCDEIKLLNMPKSRLWSFAWRNNL